MAPATLPQILAERLALSPSAEAYRTFDPVAARWLSLTWREFGQRVLEWRAALGGEGLAAAARIAILVPNGVEHLCMDQAALSLGLVPVPMHLIDEPESLAYVLSDSGAALLLIDTVAHWEALAPHAARFPTLTRVVYLSGQSSSAEGIARPLAQWLEAGRAAAHNPPGAEYAAAPDTLAALVYTSGTTGRPKGVMLTHRNVVANVEAILSVIPVFESDVFLSFLPLSHTLERTAGYYLPMAAGAAVAFARSVQALPSDLISVRPTVLISVPRIYERAYTAIRDALARRAVSRTLFDWTVSLGWQRLEHAARAARAPSLLARSLWRLLDRWVAAKVRSRFGGRLRAAVTGGAPIPQSVARTFLALGVPLLQGYGLTECSPVVACNRPEDNQPDSVGPPLPGVEVRIGANDELLVRGPSVMRGYWERPQETAGVLDRDGWLHTGDQARIEQGRLSIRGRIKDIIVTSTGEKIGPADLESAILADPLFEQVMVIGEGRPYLAALLVLNRDQWAREAEQLGLDPADPASLRAKAAVDRALERIARAVSAFPGYARPRAASLSLAGWTVDAGLLTPTLKPKRAALEKYLAAEVAALYRGHADPT